MSLTQLDFEAGVNGANVAIGSSSGFSAITTGSGTLTYDGTHAAHGSQAVKLSSTASSATYGSVAGFDTAQLAIEFSIWFDTAVTSDTWPIYVIDTAGVGICRAYLSSSNQLRVSASGGVVVWTATQAFPLSQWVRVALFVSVATSTLKVSYYLGNATTPVETGYSNVGSVNVGTANIDSIHIGKANASTYASSYWFDAVQYDPAATNFIGPWAAPGTTTSGAYIWNGTQWVRHIPYVHSASGWDMYDFIS